MTHNPHGRPRFFPLRREAQWLFHNAVIHPTVGTLNFAAALLHHTGSTLVAPKLLEFSNHLHDRTMPGRDEITTPE